MEKVIIFQTYYKPEQFEEYHLDKLPSFVKVVNTVLDDYPLRELNPFWSEYPISFGVTNLSDCINVTAP